MTANDFTLLKAAGGIRLTKKWKADGTLDAYGDVRNYRSRVVKVANVRELSALLLKIQSKPDVCHIRAIPKPEAERNLIETPEIEGHHRRTKELHDDGPQHALCGDIDGYKPTLYDPVLDPVGATEELIAEHMPAEFQGISFHVQLSSSAGRPENAGILKAHVWWWLTKPMTSAQLTHWASVTGVPLDKTAFRAVQVHYTANPVFEDGVVDPVPVRSVFAPGWLGDEVDLVLPENTDMILAAAGAGAGDGKTYPDARAKPGLIGAFCRAYTMDEIWDEYLPGQFERVPGSDRRVTWHLGGGSAEGCFVDSTGEWLVNTHNTSPHGERATNKWDLARVQLFGDRDTPEILRDNFDISALPSHQAMLAMVANDARVQEEMSRGEVLAREQTVEAASDWASQIAACVDEPALREICTGVAHDRGVDRVSREILAAAVQGKMRDLTQVKIPINVARGMVGVGRSVMAGAGGAWGAGGGGQLELPDLSPLGLPQETEGNVLALCEHQGIVVRYNVITKEDEILVPGASWSMDNRVAASLTHVRSECHRHEIRTNHLKKFITLVAERNLYNPAAEFILSRPWDGVSRAKAFYATIEEDTTKITVTLKQLLMRKWMISAVVAAMSPDGVSARGVLTFQGLQYIGKTRWIMSLVPRGLGLVKEGKAVDPHNKDSLEQALSMWLGELGEIDSTFRKSDIAALKAFITSQFDEFRRPYAEAKSQYARRTVFAASVNDEQFLVDPTGNTRFWVVPTLRAIHDHGLDMQQVFAEFYQLWLAGEVHWMSVPEMELLNDSNEQYSAPDPITEMLASHLDWDSYDRYDPQTYKWLQVSDVLRWIGSKNPTRSETILAGKALNKLNGGNHRKSHGTKLCAVPLQRKDVYVEDFFDEVSDRGNGAEDRGLVTEPSDPANALL